MKNVFFLKQRQVLSEAKVQQIILSALPTIRRYAYSLTANSTDADDLLQSLVERLLKQSIPSDVQPLPWMLKVCRNMWVDELRKRKVKHQYLDALVSETEGPPTLEQSISEQDSQDSVLGALSKLSPAHREVMSLVVVSGLSYAEAAEVLDVPVGTIMSRIARARHALSNILKR